MYGHWLLLIWLFVVSCSDYAEDRQGSIEESLAENRVLASELKLAQKPSVYFLFVLPHKQIYVKQRGRVLKALRIAAVHRCGHATEIRPHVLVKGKTRQKYCKIIEV